MITIGIDVKRLAIAPFRPYERHPKTVQNQASKKHISKTVAIANKLFMDFRDNNYRDVRT